MKKKQIILSKEDINNKINRISFSIIEDYYQEKEITLIVIQELKEQIVQSNKKYKRNGNFHHKHFL